MSTTSINFIVPKSGQLLIAAALVYMATNADSPSFNLTIPTILDQFGSS